MSRYSAASASLSSTRRVGAARLVMILSLRHLIDVLCVKTTRDVDSMRSLVSVRQVELSCVLMTHAPVGGLTAALAARIRSLRDARGKRQTDLADDMTALGFDWGRTTVQKLE